MSTPNLELPEVPEAIEESSDEINDGFRRLDAIVQLAVLDRDLREPPSNPQQGDRYIIPLDAYGAWLTRRRHVAYFTAGGWRYLIPRRGWIARVLDEPDVLVEYTGTQWEELSTGGNGGGNGGSASANVYEHFSDMDFSEPGSTGTSYRSNTSGNGSVTSVSSASLLGRPGLIRVTKGPAGSGQANLYWAAEPIVLGDGETTFECSVMLNVNQATTTEFEIGAAGLAIRIGLMNLMNGAPNEAVMFTSHPDIESGNWVMTSVHSNNMTSAPTDRRPTAGEWLRFKIVVSADRSSVEYFIDNESQGTLNTNIPRTGDPLRWRFHVSSVSGYSTSNGASLLVDWVRIRKTLTTPRE